MAGGEEKMNSEYKIALIRELRDQQVRFAPRGKRLEQADRAERLLSELDASKEYPFDFLFYRVTEVRPETSSMRLIRGQDAQHDLRLFVEDITDSMNLRLEEASEPVHTVEDLSKLFNVSTKTISRWRDQGLVSRRFVTEGRKRVGFLHSSVERFVNQNKVRVERGERFSQMTDAERDDIIDRSRRLASQGANLTEVTWRKRFTGAWRRFGIRLRTLTASTPRWPCSLSSERRSRRKTSEHFISSIYEEYLQ
jgi:RNA polymerase primary sigma factor/RNA polymerase sigma factor